MKSKMIIDRKTLKKESHKNLKSTYLKSILVIFIFTLVITGGYNFTSSFNNDYNPTQKVTQTKSNFSTIDDLTKEIIKKTRKRK